MRVWDLLLRNRSMPSRGAGTGHTNSERPRRLTYEQVLARWDRSRSYGDPRSLRQFSEDMVSRLKAGDESDDCSEGLRDGPLIRLYARSEQIFGGATGLVIIAALIAILFAVLFMPRRFLFLRSMPVSAVSRNEGGGTPSVTDSPPRSKARRSILSIILTALGLAITMAVFKECQHEQLAQRANTMFTVWMPTGPDGRLIPYWDVESGVASVPRRASTCAPLSRGRTWSR